MASVAPSSPSSVSSVAHGSVSSGSLSPGPSSLSASASASVSASASASSVSPPPPPPPSSSSLSAPSLPASSPSVFSSGSGSGSSSAPFSSAPSSTTHASSTILTTPSITVAQTTMIGTSNGQTYTTIVETTFTIAAGSTISASTDTAQPASHTGAIVGGVIGGLAFLGIVGGALFWFRRRSRYRSEFDGNFDPARVTGTRPVSLDPEMIQNHTGGGTLPRMNIDDDDDGMGGRLPNSTVGGGIRFSPPMSQYSQDGYTPTMSSAGGYYAAVPQQLPAAGGYYPPAPPSSSGSSGNQYNPRSAKEREAGRSGNFAVANPSTEAGDSRPMSGGYSYNDQYQAYLRSGPQGRRGSQSEYNDPSSYPPLSPTASSSGARAADEIPPTYDSLPNENE
ncbi:hypothetical protein K438DRAFT_1799889 [Mycena galopus ATCC 62051]|nr:hypothetical protein K438DRAFT_1799889 [Mycena galopus ATCC 62051]